MPDAASAWTDIVRIREINPLVLNVTNNVVTNSTANALLALGASPAMTHAAEDAAELAGFAAALVLNIGTPALPYAESMLAAGRAAGARNIPVVLDPVAAGATAYRRRLVAALLVELDIAVIRGNASEILYLAGENVLSKGADSAHGSLEAAGAAMALAAARGCVVCVSGATDIVAGPDGRTARITGGHPMMTKVTGLGCTATALVGAFAAVNPDPFAATAHAMAAMAAAGSLAAEGAPGPGTLQVRFYDALYTLTEADLAARGGLNGNGNDNGNASGGRGE